MTWVVEITVQYKDMLMLIMVMLLILIIIKKKMHTQINEETIFTMFNKA